MCLSGTARLTNLREHGRRLKWQQTTKKIRLSSKNVDTFSASLHLGKKGSF